MSEHGALDGLAVVEFGGTTAVSYAGKLLSDLGAYVVKLEDPLGDPLRGQPPLFGAGTDEALGSRFVYLNTGKHSVTVDQPVADHLAVLCADADVLITDETTQASVPLDLPRYLVWCAVSPFGLVGPYAGYQGTHVTIFHSGGEGQLLPSGLGWEMFPDRPPLQIGSDLGDYDTGANATIAILAACMNQRRRGIGERIDVSAQEAQLTLNRTRLSRFNHDGIELRRGPSQYGIGGMVPCRNGYIQLVGMRPEHWDRLTSGPDGAGLRATAIRPGEETTDDDAWRARALREWCAARDKDEASRILAAAGCPVGAYAAPVDLIASAQLAHRSFFQRVQQPGVGSVLLPGAPYRLSRTPVRLGPAPQLGADRGLPARPAQPALDTAPSAPLAGIRVLDFTWAAAGPYATLLLGFLGAEVIKVESSRRLDPARRGFMQDYGGVNRSPNFDELNLNKRSFVVDLTQPAGLGLVKRLVAVSDVVVDNFRPGVMGRYGLDAETLLAEHPNLIVASSSANGATGPEAAGAGLASVFSATGGLGEQTGYRDGPPTEVGESTDYRSANALAIALLAALLHHQRTGEGQAIDVASREVVVGTAPDALLAHLAGAEWTPRVGNDNRRFSPHGLYACAAPGDWIAVAIRDQHDWKEFCQLLDQPAWGEAYPTAESRARERVALDQVIAAWAAQRTARDAFHLLQSRGIPACPSFTNKDLATDEHLAWRQVFIEVDHPEIGRHRVMRAPWVLSHTECPVRRPGPLLGQDNAYVLESILGIPATDHAQFGEAFR